MVRTMLQLSCLRRCSEHRGILTGTMTDESRALRKNVLPHPNLPGKCTKQLRSKDFCGVYVSSTYVCV